MNLIEELGSVVKPTMKRWKVEAFETMTQSTPTRGTQSTDLRYLKGTIDETMSAITPPLGMKSYTEILCVSLGTKKSLNETVLKLFNL